MLRQELIDCMAVVEPTSRTCIRWGILESSGFCVLVSTVFLESGLKRNARVVFLFDLYRASFPL